MTPNGDGKDINVPSRMTQQEAIKKLREDVKMGNMFGNVDVTEYKMAIEALQYRMPKIPIYSCPDFMCPKCMTYGIEDLDREKLDYCPNCGQAIDWSEK